MLTYIQRVTYLQVWYISVGIYEFMVAAFYTFYKYKEQIHLGPEVNVPGELSKIIRPNFNNKMDSSWNIGVKNVLTIEDCQKINV